MPSLQTYVPKQFAEKKLLTFERSKSVIIIFKTYLFHRHALRSVEEFLSLKPE